MLNKTTVFLLFMFTVLIAFLGGYFLSQKSDINNSSQQASLDNSLVSRFNKSSEKYVMPVGLFTISRERASFPFLTQNGKKVIYYYPNRGEVRSSSVDSLGNNSSLIATIKPWALDIQWASGSRLIAVYADGSILYDLVSGSSKKIDKNIIGPSFSKSGDHIAYVYNSLDKETGRDIRISDTDMAIFKTLLSTRISSWDIEWTDNETLSVLKQPTLDNPQSSLFTLDTRTKRLRNILASKKDLQTIWSPDGKKLLYSYVSNTKERELYVMTVPNRVPIFLGVGTSASQCTWRVDSRTVICGNENSFFSLDTSSTKPKREKITSLERDTFDVSVTELLITSSEAYLIFINTQDGKLYGLSLDK